MRKIFLFIVFILALAVGFSFGTVALAQSDIVTQTEVVTSPLEDLILKQNLGSIFPYNPIKYAILYAVSSGVPVNTIVMLLLLPLVAALIAAVRHLVGLRGFGIFLPAALAVTFVAIGPVVGIGLFLIIVSISTIVRVALRAFKTKLQYLPRMALILWFVTVSVLGFLFLTPLVPLFSIANVSIFPVLILALLAEDFTRIQLGKSIRVAVNLTFETMVLSLISYMFLTFKMLQAYVLLNPELYLLLIFAFDFLLGKYAGLRLLEFWRFRKLLKS